jgi:hypothetical protein
MRDIQESKDGMSRGRSLDTDRLERVPPSFAFRWGGTGQNGWAHEANKKTQRERWA